MNVTLLALLIVSSPSTSPPSAPIDPATVKLEYRHRDVLQPSGVTPVVNPGSLAPTEEPTPEPPLPAMRFGTKGSWRWQLQGSYGIQFDHTTNQFAMAGGGISYFLIEDVSIDLNLNGMQFWQEGDNASGIEWEILFRWHVFTNKERTWSLYGDAGVGFLFTSHDVPTNGSSFNFTPQVGAGMSFDLGGDVRLLTGARWFHISNANTYRANPGRDSLQVYAQISFPF